MSVYSMAKIAEDTAQPQSYLIALKDYIPAEALALYLFAIGILTPAADATTTDTGAIKLFCFAIGLMAVAAITINSLDRSNAEKGNGIERLGVTVSEPNRRRGVVIFWHGAHSLRMYWRHSSRLAINWLRSNSRASQS